MSAPCKKLINSVQSCVDENLEGLVAVNPGLQILDGHRVVIRSDIREHVNSGKVSLISGGGSGHEPAHAGYVGAGMLCGSVAGAVFTSPPPSSILATIKAVSGPAGCLVLFNNYTGDRLNFGLAVERATQSGIHVDSIVIGEDCALTTDDKSAAGVILIVKNYTGDRINFGKAAERAKLELGIDVEMVVVGEDCALTSSDKTAGRRGLCGTLFIHKICGALAEEGKSLQEIVQVAKEAAQNMGTIGLSLSSCSVPGSGATFHIADDEMEVGLGLHGEAGVKRTKLTSAIEAVTIMIDHMTNLQNSTHLPVKSGDHVAVMINNLGGTSMLELNILTKNAIELLESRGVFVDRAYSGAFITSLEMAGISITILFLNETLKRCLDAPTSAPAWPHPLLARGQTDRVSPDKILLTPQHQQSTGTGTNMAKVTEEQSKIIFRCIKSLAEKLIQNEVILNDLDKESGDGDCGSTMARGCQGILSKLGSPDDSRLPVSCPGELALCLANIAEETMGGSSGGLYSLFFTAASGGLKEACAMENWKKALQDGISSIMKYGGAEKGDRTMLDPLYAALESWEASKISTGSQFASIAKAAVTQAEATKHMKARAGRASYVNAEHLKQPDPGAVAVGMWMTAIAEELAA